MFRMVIVGVLALGSVHCATSGKVPGDCPKPIPCSVGAVLKEVPPPLKAAKLSRDSSRQLTLKAFSADGKRVALEVVDSLAGSACEVYTLEDPKRLVRQIFESATARIIGARFGKDEGEAIAGSIPKQSQAG